VSAPVAVVAPNAVKTALKINPKIKKVAVFLPKMMLLVNRKRKLFKKP
jgi:hypothetical protein